MQEKGGRRQQQKPGSNKSAWIPEEEDGEGSRPKSAPCVTSRDFLLPNKRQLEPGAGGAAEVSTADCTDHRYIPRSPAVADALAAKRDKRWEEASPPFYSD
ncbi:unnamed protein product [Lota lota]